MILSKPINNIIKVKVNTIMKSAKRRADDHFNKKIKSKTVNLEDFDALVLLDKELESIKKKVKKSDYIFYIEYASSPEWLISQFASRTFLLNVDESIVLEEAIFLSKYKDNLSKAIRKIKDKIPLYTYDDFINGDICEFFLNFKYYKNINEQDYYSIVKWQSENVIKIISYESSMLINNIQVHCKNIENPLFFIKSQIEIFEELLNNESNNSIELKEILSKLYVFKHFDFKNYKDDLILENYKIYKNEEFHWHKTDFIQIKPIVDFLDLKPNNVFSNEFLIFHTLDKLNIWFEEIAKGKPLQDIYEFPDYEKELEKLELEAKLEVERLSDLMYDNLYHKDKTDEEVKHYMVELFDSVRIRFNKIKNIDIMHLLDDNRKHILLSYFTTNSFFGNDLKKVSSNLKENIIVQEFAWEIYVAHNDFFNSKNVFDNKDYGATEVTMLLNKMILDNKLYKATRKTQMKFFSDFEKCSLPMDFHLKNIQEGFVHLFSEALNKLQEILDDAEPSNKIMFLQSRIKEIKQREIQMLIYEKEFQYEKNENRYSNLLKDFFEVEADFIKETIHIPRLPILEYQAPRQLPSPDETFETITNEKNQVFILKMMEDLSITLNGKSIISQRKKGAIRGIVEALKQNNILPNRSIDDLSKIIGNKIKLDINSKLDFSDTSENYKKEANQYITKNYFH